jgi:alpha-mannosidase
MKQQSSTILNGKTETDCEAEAKQLIQCHFISNTHWDREWRFSMQRTRHMLVYMLDMLLDIFEKEPSFKSFHLDSQTIPLQDYLEIRPEKEEVIKTLIREKKIMAGPWFCLPDEFSVGGESLIRNLLLGHKIARRFGYVSKTGYSPFSWGQISQMPQIYKGFGIDFAAFYRGVNTEVAPRSEFIWQGADGTQLVASRLGRRPRYNVWYLIQRPAFWKMKDVNCRVIGWDCGFGPFKFVGDMYSDFDTQYSRQRFIYDETTIAVSARAAIEEQDEDWATLHRFWSCGHDSSCPDIREVRMIRDCNQALRGTANVFHSTFESFQHEVIDSVNGNLPIVIGEMRYLSDSKSTSPLFGWILSARMDLKIENFKTERELIYYAEPLAVYAGMLGAEYPGSFLNQACNWLLQNHGHDSIGGCSREIVGLDMQYRYRQAREIAGCVAERALLDIAGTINYDDLAAEQMVLLVYNPAPFTRDEVVTLNLDVPREWNSETIGIIDENSEKQEIQIVGSQKEHFHIVQSPNDTANMFESRLYRVKARVKHIPPMGYRTFFIRPATKVPTGSRVSLVTGPQTLENQYLQVTVNANGALTVFDKQTNRLFENMGYFRDTGEIGNPWQHEDVEQKEVFTTLYENAEIVLVQDNALEASYRIRWEWALPQCRAEGDKSRSDNRRIVLITNTVTLRINQPWIEIETAIDNTVEDHYLQVCFPCNIASDVIHAQGQFDVIERAVIRADSDRYLEPPQSEQPMNSFIDITDGRSGLAILNEGLKAYEATQEARPELRLTLLRSFPLRICVTQEMIDYSTVDKSSQCLGRHSFRYAVMPHSGNWLQADIWRVSEQFNLPLVIAQTAPTEGGTEPIRKSFLEICPETLHVSAVKRSENGDGWIIRLYNPYDKSVRTKVRLNGGFENIKGFKSPVQRLQDDMTLPSDVDKRNWRFVRLVSLEEVIEKELALDTEGWCAVEVAPKKIMTIEFSGR